MIKETNSRKNSPAITSDQWHVVRASWNGLLGGEPRFDRAIVSEHEDRRSAQLAGRALAEQVAREWSGRPAEHCDQVLVRPPDYKSLKSSKRIVKSK